MSKKKVFVIGAGPGGLSCAMLLAYRGFDVTILEKTDAIGGRNAAFNLGDYTFDTGPTFFLMKDVLERIFESTDRNLHDYVTLTEIDPMYRLVFNNDKVFYPSTDEQKMKAEIERVFPGSSAGYDKYMQKEKVKYDRLIPCLEVPYCSFTDLFKKRFIKAIPYLDAHLSLFDVLGRYFKYEELKLAFTFQAKYIGMSPWKAPGTFSLISYIEHGDGIYHVEGGLNQLSHAMAKVFEEFGGKIQFSSNVKEVIIEGDKAKGVKLQDGRTYSSDYVVINSDFAYSMTNLIAEEKRKKYTDAKLAAKEYSCSTYMLYLGVNKVYDDIPHHSIIFADDYRANVKDITEDFVPSDDTSFYIQNASITDKTLAPEGKSAIYVLVPTTNNKSNLNWEAEKDKTRDRLIKLLETKGGFTDISKHIEEERIITPQEWEDDYNVYLGAVFNLGHQISQMLFLRPHNRFECFKNCYLVGGGTHPGSGLPTIYESGRISADLLTEDAKQ
ncbi:MAG: phytoene desaturase [Gammaproteobacteria bacterium]|mgnify:FL=1|nr:MAG: phytoene desaturase [Gammaproteobacteria bacterium]